MLTAHSVKKGVVVVARLLVGGLQGLTLVDTAKVNVNASASASPLTTLAAHSPGDSGKVALSIPAAIAVNILDSTDTAIPDALYYLWVLDTTIVNCSGSCHNSGAITTRNIGHTKLVAEATVYGVSKSDTIDIAVGQTLFKEIDLQTSGLTTTFFPSIVTIGAGGVVRLVNKLTDQSVDIVFDDSSAAQSALQSDIPLTNCFLFVCPTVSGAGNFHALPPLSASFPHADGFDYRKFMTAGTYTYHSVPFNAQGKIIVQ
jgi:hypothetical protein